MFRRLSIIPLSILWIAVIAPVAMAQAAPKLVSAVSRRLHGATAYDIPLPLTGNSGIECRTVDAGFTIVCTFDKTISSANAAVTTGVATISGSPAISRNQALVTLSNVANAQAITLALSNIVSTGGGAAGSASVTFRVLEGDVNANGSVSGSDVNIVKYNVGRAVDGFTFRSDINANGSISGSDVNIAKLRVDTSCAGGTSQNTAPTIGAIATQTATASVATGAIPFTIGDAESDPATLGVIANSNNQSLLPDANIALGGSGANRTLTLSPAAGQSGTVTITVTVGDGLLTTAASFQLIVTTPTVGGGGGGGGAPLLFLASLRPEAGVTSSASGSATLQLSADQTYALLRFSYGNLTSARTGEHIHGPADPGASGGMLFDIDITTPGADGSYKWVFVNSGNASVADQVAAIRAGRIYMNVHTATFPNGEIRGQFLAAAGSQTFTPPAAPPALPGGLPTQQDAVRFLRQATYGPTSDQITWLQANGYDGWLNDQFNKPPTSMHDMLAAWQSGGTVIYKDQLWSSWWAIANTAPDQLRQRVAFSLSEIFVVSGVAAGLDLQNLGVARYYDALGADAFGNFRTLLQDMTLHPAMGLYLNMLGNWKADPVHGTTPNENYAREVMQLFTIGLNQLQPDGTLKLDARGLPIATYVQSDVQGMARVFTGWHYFQNGGQSPWAAADFDHPMALITSGHETGSKAILNGVVIPANQSADQDLKQALDTLFNHPNVGPFISRQLIQKLVTSNPSPAYVYRVAQIFNNNGAGVRGDLKAVVRAILTDYEARSSTMLNQQGFGKLNEPILRTTQIMRAFHSFDSTGLNHWGLDITDELLDQTPMYQPSVFNFYSPSYVQPGTIASAGLVAPEFQILTETSTLAAANFIEHGIYGGFKYGAIKLNLAAEQAYGNDTAGLVDHVSLLLCSAPLPAAVRQIVMNQVALQADALSRAQMAIRLISLTPEAAVQK